MRKPAIAIALALLIVLAVLYGLRPNDSRPAPSASPATATEIPPSDPQVGIPIAPQTTLSEFQLGRIVGRVELPAPLQLPPDAQVTLHWANTDDPSPADTAPLDDGRFVFEELPFGDYTAAIEILGGRAQQTVTLDRNRLSAEVSLELQPLGALSGRVTDTSGTPVTGASIALTYPVSGNATTDENGLYSFPAIASGKHTLQATALGHADSKLVYAQPPATDVDFALATLAGVGGRVVRDADGQTLRNYRVRARIKSPDRAIERDDWTEVSDTEGRFWLANLDPGDVTVEVRATGFADAAESLGSLARGETVRDILIRLEEGAWLRGRVLDAEGNPVERATLFVGDVPKTPFERNREIRGLTGADGEFHLTDLKNGRIPISVEHVRYTPTQRTINVAPGHDNRQDIYLSQGAIVTGIISQDGAPLAGQHVVVGYNKSVNEVLTGEDGRYRSSGLYAGPVSVTVIVRPFNRSERRQSQWVTVANDTVYEVNFDFSSGAAQIGGTVYAAAGVPARPFEELSPEGSMFRHVDITVQMEFPDGRSEMFSSQADYVGRYRITGLPAGIARLSASFNEIGRTFALEVGDGERIHQDIELFGFVDFDVFVENIPKGYFAQVGLLNGTIDLSGVSNDAFEQRYRMKFLHLSMVSGDRAPFRQVYPGHYTAVAMLRSEVGSNVYRWKAAPVDVRPGTTKPIKMAF